MRILLIGASGMIGSRILQEVRDRGHQVIAAARNPEKIDKTGRVVTAALDVFDPRAVAAQAHEADVIISAVSPRSTGDPTEEALGFTKALIAAHRETGKRLVMVGGGGTLQLPDGRPVWPHVPAEYVEEAKAMRRAYGLLVSEDIDFTVLAPSGMIMPGERTATFRLGDRLMLVDEQGQGSISAEDYAIALVDEVETPRHFRTVFTVGY